MTKPSEARPSAKLATNTRKRWLLAALAMLIVGWLSIVSAIEFLAPNWVEHTLATQISQRLGVSIRIERVSTEAFEGKLAVYGVSVNDKNGQPLIGFRELHLDYSWLSLLSPVWVLESATIVAPSIHLRLPASGPLTLMQLVPSSDGPAVETPRWQLKHLAIREGELSYRDERVAPAREFAVSHWGFELDDIGTESANGRAELHGELPAGASIDWVGDIGLQPLTSTGRLQISKLSLPETLGWLPEQLPLTVNAGRLSVDINYVATLQPELSLAISNSTVNLAALSLSLLNSQTQAQTEQQQELASVASLQASGLAFAYPSGEWASEVLTLKGAAVAIERDKKGEFALLKALAGPPRTRVAADAPSAPIDWAGSLKKASVSDVMIRYRDLSTRPVTTLSLGPLALTATPKAGSENSQDTLALELTSSLNTSANLSLRGEFGMPSVRANKPAATPYFSGRISLDKLALKPFEGLIADVLAIRLPSGELNSDGQLQWQTPAAPSWAWRGDSALTDLRILEARGQPLLSLTALRVDGIKAQGTPLQVGINRVLIDSPKLRINRQADGSLNITNLSKAGASSTSTAATANPDIFINTLAVRGGTVAFADNAIVPSMATALSQLNGSLRSLDLTGRQRTQVKVRGYLPNAAPIALEGEVNVVNPSRALNLSLRAERLALAPYSPYASRYAGYALANGLLWADLSYDIKQGALSAENTIRVSDFTWGEASGSAAATGLPVRLGTALLKDVNGEIHLDVPLTGNLSDPEFRLWPIVWQTLGNLITRAAAAPFKLLGGLADAGDDLSHIRFIANSATLNEAAMTQITTLAASLKGKPELRIRLNGHSDGAHDVTNNNAPAVSAEAANKRRYDLAKARAVSVQNALISAGVTAEQVLLEQPKATTEASMSVSLSIGLAD